MKANLATLAVVVVAGILYFRTEAAQPWTPWRIVGLAMGVPAFALFFLARLQLGSAFSIQAKASTLVRTGLYARIRNPIYLFGGWLIAAVIVYLDRPWWLLIFAVLIPMQMLRVRKEEQALEAKFGDEYRAYKRTTWF